MNEGTPRLGSLGLVMLLQEAQAAIGYRRARAALTVLGTVLGIAALVSIVGLTATAQNQVSRHFDVLAATSVTLQDTSPQKPSPAFPSDGVQRLNGIKGVTASGFFHQVGGGDFNVSAAPRPSSDAAPLVSPVLGVSPSLFTVLHARLASGRQLQPADAIRGERVAVIGASLATRIGLPPVSEAPAVFLNGVGFTVVGVLQDVSRRPDMLLAALVPFETAEAVWGPASSVEGIVETRPGAGGVVAAQASIALHPEDPQRIIAIPPPDLTSLRDRVSDDFATLLLVLAGVALVIGMVGIANTTLVAVLERVGEIGLRRALGARRWQISAQFLLESATLGVIGGVAGSALGTIVVVVASLAKTWTPIVPPWAVLITPALGLLTGLLAGLYPAAKAARLAPVEALRR